MLIKILRQRILLSLWLEIILLTKKKKRKKNNTRILKFKSKLTKPHYRFDCAMSNRSYSPRYYIVKALAYYYHCYLFTLKYYCYRYHIMH